MTTVLRNSNTNKIKVIYFSKPKYIRKISSNKRYHKYLINEVSGLQWYHKISGNQGDLIRFFKKANLFFLNIKIFNGKKNIFYKSIIENENLISKAIDHYASIWPKKINVRCHGDLTVDNILLKEEKIKFIDWELSGHNEKWGYDLVYLLISSIFFPYYINKNLTDTEKKVFKRLWFKLKEYNISKEILKNPLENFTKIYKKKNGNKLLKITQIKFTRNFLIKNLKKYLKN